jgi:hypothetical protein
LNSNYCYLGPSHFLLFDLEVELLLPWSISLSSPQAQIIIVFILFSLLKLELLQPWSLFLCSNSSYCYLGPFSSFWIQAIITMVLLSILSLSSRLNHFLPWSFFLSLLLELELVIALVLSLSPQA